MKIANEFYKDVHEEWDGTGQPKMGWRKLADYICHQARYYELGDFWHYYKDDEDDENNYVRVEVEEDQDQFFQKPGKMAVEIITPVSHKTFKFYEKREAVKFLAGHLQMAFEGRLMAER